MKVEPKYDVGNKVWIIEYVDTEPVKRNGIYVYYKSVNTKISDVEIVMTRNYIDVTYVCGYYCVRRSGDHIYSTRKMAQKAANKENRKLAWRFEQGS